MTANVETANSRRSSRRSRRKQKLLPYVADSILLEEAGMPWLVRSSIIAATVIVILFFGWAATTRSPEVSVAMGRIKPSGNIQVVQHLEGGSSPISWSRKATSSNAAKAW